MTFDDPNMLARLKTLSDAALDALEFGVVRMTPSGDVVSYNRWESERAGLAPASVIGRNFFEAVAPCTNNFMVAERFMSEPELDAIIDYTFTFRLRPTKVKLRLLRSNDAAHNHLLVDWRR